MTTKAEAFNEMGNRWFPLPPEKFFTMQRANDMWFPDELPPTLQAEMRSPLVTQSKAMLAFQVLQVLARGEQHAIMEREQTRRRGALLHVGKRRKVTGH